MTEYYIMINRHDQTIDERLASLAAVGRSHSTSGSCFIVDTTRNQVVMRDNVLWELERGGAVVRSAIDVKSIGAIVNAGTGTIMFRRDKKPAAVLAPRRRKKKKETIAAPLSVEICPRCGKAGIGGGRWCTCINTESSETS